MNELEKLVPEIQLKIQDIVESKESSKVKRVKGEDGNSSFNKSSQKLILFHQNKEVKC